MAHPDDGKFVVVQGGQRVSGQLHEKKDTAQAEATAVEKKRPVQETEQPVAESQPVKVVQNLYG